MKQLNLDEIVNMNKSELIILKEKVLFGKKVIMINILNETLKRNLPTIFFSLELSMEEVIKKIYYNKSNLFLQNKSYIESIINNCREIKSKVDIKLVMIDGLYDIKTKEAYFLGQGDIISIIIKQLKELSQELNVTILITAPSNISIDEFKRNYIEVLNYFCKGEKAKDFVDKIILVNEEKLIIKILRSYE